MRVFPACAIVRLPAGSGHAERTAFGRLGARSRDWQRPGAGAAQPPAKPSAPTMPLPGRSSASC